MKILIVCSGNAGEIAPFIKEQADSVRQQGVEVGFFPVKGKGFCGYLKNLTKLRRLLLKTDVDLIHAHYGLSGLLANLQRRVPVITTFHGSDIHTIKNRFLSGLAMQLSKHNIFVSPGMAQKISARKDFSVIPCGVDLQTFFPVPKHEARKKLELNENERLILFSGSFANKIKNYPLAKESIDRLGYSVRLIELKGYTREQVNLLFNACDMALLTSFHEGSPQVIKEGMACNRPVVATRTGDIEWQFGDQPGYFLCSFDKEDVAEKIQRALTFSLSEGSTHGRERIVKLGLDSASVAEKIVHLYQHIRSGDGTEA
ncbi:MAG TPA: glycosyltransferase [Bacteroidales bacterium]|nr:glycosyltransferase [Bacteroidales bacterium]